MRALILFYFKIEAETVDDIARLWGYLKYLSEANLLSIAQLPFKLS